VKKLLLIPVFLLVACQPKITYVPTKMKRPAIPARPIDRARNLPPDADLATLVEALLKDHEDWRAYIDILLQVIETTTEP
jgi:hypothetical protein